VIEISEELEKKNIALKGLKETKWLPSVLVRKGL
jgi:hypothetical protein